MLRRRLRLPLIVPLPSASFRMDLRRLEVFAKAAERGCFSRAAEALFLLQTTVSEHVRAREDEPGVPLPDRLGRGATGVGVALVSQRTVEDECRAGLLRALRVDDLRVARAFHLVTHRERSHSPLAQAFLEVVESEYPGAPSQTSP